MALPAVLVILTAAERRSLKKRVRRSRTACFGQSPLAGSGDRSLPGGCLRIERYQHTEQAAGNRPPHDRRFRLG